VQVGTCLLEMMDEAASYHSLVEFGLLVQETYRPVPRGAIGRLAVLPEEDQLGPPP